MTLPDWPQRNGMTVKPIGYVKQQKIQHERNQATVLEGVKGKRLGLFGLHHVDWLHIETPQRDRGTLKAGHPDYLILGDAWSAFLEIKARDPVTKRLGRLMPHQRSFHDKLRRAGHEVWVAYLPDDLALVNESLRAKTGIVVDIDGLKA